MTPERWTRLAELFEAALERDPRDRAAFLAAACPDDDELRREVELVLDSHERAGSFGDSAAFQIAVVDPPRVHGSLAAGARLGRYEIVSLVGKGGMGEVYRARDPQLGRDVGIKILPRRDEISLDQLRRFEREARTVGALNHANILTVYDVGIDTDIPYVVSELLEGETLRARLSSGPLPIEQSIDIAPQIVSGLAAAHDKGIVHRDLKPANIFITTGGVAKILDFGLAKQTIGIPAHDGGDVGSLTGQGLVIGTAGYMSPEQVRGGEADARSDVFAFGTVLYEMLTGQRAFTGDSAVETMNAILTTEPPAVSVATPAVPADLEHLVHRCLDKDPDRRFASAHDLGAALKTARGDRSPARVEPPSTRSARSGQAALPAAPQRTVLAVLPFENVSDDEDQEYFSDGLTDEMIAQLGRLNPQRLGVIARTSAMKYKHTHKSVDVIGRELSAAYILEGSVRRSASRVRVTARLIQVSDQTHLWSQSYDREIGDMLALQSDVANAIAGEIRVQLTPEQRVRLASVQSVDPAAYEAYLKGRYFWNRRTRDSLEKSVQYFQKAIEIDPGRAAAHAGLADAYLTQQDYNYLPPREAFAVADQEIQEALRLDPALAEPHTSLGHLRLHQFDWPSAEREFTRAIELNTGYGTAHYYYGNLLAAQGRFDEALVEANRALEVDPMSPNTRQNRVFILYLARRYEEAIEQAHETVEIDASYTAIHYYLGLIYERQGRYAEAIDAFEKVTPENHKRGSTVLAAIGSTHARAGNRHEASQILERLESASVHEYVPSYELALLHLALGNTDRACALLTKACDDHSSFVPFLNVDARLDGVRSDPRVQALAQRMKLPVVQMTSSPRTPWTRSARIAAAVLVVAALAAAAWQGRRPPAAATEIQPVQAIAVLPLANLTGDPDQEYFVDGMTEALIASLSRIGALRVISRTSAMQYKGARRTAARIAKELNVDAIVEGSVQRSGPRVRVTARLIRVPSETPLWMDTYERETPDVLMLQSEVSQAIAREIRVTITPQEQARLSEQRVVDSKAYDAYLRGRYWLNKRTEDAFQQGLDYCVQATKLDPRYTLAWACVADAYILLGAGDYGSMSPREAMPRARDAALKALELDDTLAEAHTSLGFLHYVFDWDWESADRQYRRALELDPAYPTAHHWYSLYLSAMGRREEAFDHAARAESLDPLSLIINTDRGVVFYRARQFDRAIAQFHRTLEIEPTFATARWGLGRAYVQAGQFAQGIRELQQAADSSGGNPVYLAALGHAFASSGDRARARAIRQQLLAQSKERFVLPNLFAMIDAGLGDADSAFRWLEAAYETRSDFLIVLNVEPALDPLRGDPRFQRLLERMRLPQDAARAGNHLSVPSISR